MLIGNLLKTRVLNVDQLAVKEKKLSLTMFIALISIMHVKYDKRYKLLNAYTFQVGGTGQRSRVLMTMAAGQLFLDTLNKMGQEAAKLEPWNPSNLAVDGKLTAQSIVKDNRRYYFDLKENNRGRFLRVS